MHHHHHHHQKKNLEKVCDWNQEHLQLSTVCVLFATATRTTKNDNQYVREDQKNDFDTRCCLNMIKNDKRLSAEEEADLTSSEQEHDWLDEN